MDNVIPDAVAEREKRHFGCKIGKILKEIVFAYLLGGARIDGYDADAIAGVLDFWGFRISAAGEDIDGKTKTGNVAAEFSHVHIHPAGVFAAKVGER